MFWETYEKLCKENGTSPTGLAIELGFSNATASKWKKGAVPNGATLKKIADHFGVSVTLLLEGIPDSPFFLGLTKEESELIMAYRSASQGIKESVCILLGVKVEQKQTEKKKTSVV